MQIILHGTKPAKQELLSKAASITTVHYVPSIQNFLDYPEAEIYIDLSFENDKNTITLLKKLNGLVIINSVSYTLAETDPSFIRINGWPGFFETAIIEASCAQANLKQPAEAVFKELNKIPEWLPDEPGFITPRVISMIINEAYFALEQEISSKEEIDTAMKLGTNYPFGPFEWSDKIGLDKIYNLLLKLSATNKRYLPAPLLEKEVIESWR